MHQHNSLKFWEHDTVADIKKDRATVDNMIADISDKVQKGIFDPSQGTESYKRSRKILVESILAAGNQVGNCDEMTAAAFRYLRDSLNVRPLDWMNQGDNPHQMQHAFIVIGRPAGSLPADLDDIHPWPVIKNWGAAAVLCDPYEKKVIATPQEIMKHLAGQFLQLWYHED